MIKGTKLEFVFFICMVASLMVVIGSGYAAESVTAGENKEKLIKTNSCKGCDLAGVNLNRADLSNADLEGADLSQAKMYLVNLTKANLRNADLRGVSFGGADLADADLRGADLRGTSLDGAYLGGTLLDGMLVATKPYESEGISELEKEVYVADPSKPKEKPQSKEVVVAPRRVFEEPPPVLVVQKSEAKSRKIIYPQAPKVKKMTPMAGTEVEEKRIKTTEIVEKNSVDNVDVAEMKKSIITDNKEIESAVSTVLSETMEIGDKSKNLAADKRKRDNLTRLLDTNKCYGCDLSGLDLSKKDLDGADLEKADLTDCNLEKTSFEKANMKGALLLRANLRGADLEKTDFYRADLTGADMTGAKTEGTLFDSAVGVNNAGILLD